MARKQTSVLTYNDSLRRGYGLSPETPIPVLDDYAFLNRMRQDLEQTILLHSARRREAECRRESLEYGFSDGTNEALAGCLSGLQAALDSLNACRLAILADWGISR